MSHSDHIACESPTVVTLRAGAVRQAKLSQQVCPTIQLASWMVGLFYARGINADRKGGEISECLLSGAYMNVRLEAKR